MMSGVRVMAVAVVCGAALAACAYPYPVAPVTAVPTTSRYDSAFAAAAGAMRDQGVALGVQDQSAGRLAGTRNSRQVTASVLRQADGTVRVQFDGDDPADPGLLDRISRSYDARMGR